MNNQPPPPPHGPPSLDREREIEEHRLHLQQQQQQQQQEEMARREREQQNERQHREPYQSTPPHQNNTGTIPLHQPVASRPGGAIHSPGGILANHGVSSQSGPLEGPRNAPFGGPLPIDGNRNIQQQYPAHPQQHHANFTQSIGVNQHSNGPVQPLGLPNGAGGVFGGPLHEAARIQSMQFSQVQAQAQANAQHQANAQQMPPGQGVGQGQQPILHDALSYLDQVKVQFSDQPDVYNRFLDIMKDFKSQAIDTPGVINRVSELFAGHPNLIQGFNTFLPPGYRIECGGNNDPNTIRVTTPMGTTLQSINGTSRPIPIEPGNGQGSTNGGLFYGGAGPQRPGAWQTLPNAGSPEAFSPPVPVQHPPPPYGQAQATQAAPYPPTVQQQINSGGRDGQAVVTLNAAANAAMQRNVTPTPGAQAAAQQAGNEKRGPVEFNHAISYVNKIKNRFQDKPEIYKQFLEILQTYQRESKPIQDVYAQVTQLFSTAPDLLEDFKQFLPESAAAAKKASEDAAALAGVAVASHANHVGNRQEQKLPPVGHFPPPQSTGKDPKKRARPAASAGESSRSSALQLDSRSNLNQGASNKRMKTTHGKSMQANSPNVSPSLTPARPQPIAPTTTTGATADEFGLFERAKKFIGNKQTMNEFLKLCNLYSQDLIDKQVLVYKIRNYIGGNQDLMDYFKDLLQYKEEPEVIENKPKLPSGRVSLSNCRGLGPSYRLLPKRERLRKCSGRDEMCHSVLNDEWASHPTWASEDSGFVAHRKNSFEEALHRIEEERHDYDFNIEANAKVIQLLEPIGNAIMNLNPNESLSHEFPRSLGENRSIYRRVLKRVYGNEKGLQVAEDLFRYPIEVVPVVLTRLKQKDEEWRFTQREWDKVWHAQTKMMYLKSLDHMGLQVKNQDKKLFNPKSVVDLIKTKAEEQRRQKLGGTAKVAKYQLTYDFDDEDVVLDAMRLVWTHIDNTSQLNVTERDRTWAFIESFLLRFFGISKARLIEKVGSISRASPDDEEDSATPAELSGSRVSRQNGRNPNLLRGVLERGRPGANGRQKDSSATGSKESTPDVGSVADEEMADAPEDLGAAEISNDRWMASTPSAANHANPLEDPGIRADELFPRSWFNLYCNHTILNFFYLFEILYKRLKDVKECEKEAAEAVERYNQPRPAVEIGLMDKKMSDYFAPGSTDSYYHSVLDLLEAFIKNEVGEAEFQGYMRQFYLRKGWALYTIQDLMKQLCKLSSVCAGNDSKDKTSEIIRLFEANRLDEETSFNSEINLRKSVEKYIKDGDMFVIRYYTSQRHATVQIMSKNDTTFNTDDMEIGQRWQYYVSSYIRVEPTEGVPRPKQSSVVKLRNMPQSDSTTDNDDALEAKRGAMEYDEGLEIRICLNSYKFLYQPNTADWFFYNKGMPSQGEGSVNSTEMREKEKERHERLRSKRNDGFKEKFVMNNLWMKGMSQQQVEEQNRGFEEWMAKGVIPGSGSGSGASGAANAATVAPADRMDVDEE